jgi:hypothetical protein
MRNGAMPPTPATALILVSTKREVPDYVEKIVETTVDDLLAGKFALLCNYIAAAIATCWPRKRKHAADAAHASAARLAPGGLASTGNDDTPQAIPR